MIFNLSICFWKEIIFIEISHCIYNERDFLEKKPIMKFNILLTFYILLATILQMLAYHT